MGTFESIILSLGGTPWLFALIAFCLILFFFPIGEEIIIFTTGYLAAHQSGAAWFPALVACVAGMFYTDYYFFLLFRFFGQRLLAHKFFQRYLPEGRRTKFLDLAKRRGAWAVFIVRFVPGGFRNPVFAMCGLSHLPHKKFIAASLAGASIMVHVTFWAGYYLSEYLPPIGDLLALVIKNARNIVGVLAALLVLRYALKRLWRRRSPIPPARSREE